MINGYGAYPNLLTEYRAEIGLNLTDMAFLIVMSGACRGDDLRVSMSIRDFQLRTGLSSQGVVNVLRRLTDSGLVAKHRNGVGATKNTYDLDGLRQVLEVIGRNIAMSPHELDGLAELRSRLIQSADQPVH